ncbi:hypothetical protein [Falsiphaeobacter marinintestinus]|uniref:hypothetical protein n=1 Tax=Falsiphaeobacter marinintestinus TaxID=1492905 RepID=UPI0011B5A2A8|nr:hypothetical protein [Phaeobacter marinintestinus]
MIWKRSDKPGNARVYKTSAGLEFWMDYRMAEAPMVASTIRTVNPETFITFVPVGMRGDDIFLMQHGRRRIAFATPSASTMMDTNHYHDLRANNPQVDLPIPRIADKVTWNEHVGDTLEVRLHDISCDTRFATRAEQDDMTGLFCEMMGWAVQSQMAMYRGKFDNPKLVFEHKRVGFTPDLQAKLDAGDFL